MTSHAIASLRKSHPNLKITILTRPLFKPFFREIENLEFVSPDLKGKHKGFFGVLRLGRELQTLGITHVADLHDILRTKILRAVFKFKRYKIAVIDKGRKEKRALTRNSYKFKIPLKTTVERYCDTFERLGFPVVLPTEMAEKSPKPLSGEIISVTSKKSGIWIGIAPFAQHESKIYPLELMAEVIRDLSGKYENIFIFGGGEEEKRYGDKMQAEFRNVTSVIGKMSLNSELDIISNLDIMISMDSSAMHMASLYGIPLISVWGATHPYAGFYGFRQDPDNSIQLDLECRPCSVYGNKSCKFNDYRCMNNIPPSVIVKRVEEVISDMFSKTRPCKGNE